MMLEFCCNNMEAYATEKNSLVDYEPRYRSYSFYVYNHPHGTRQEMWFCPWCGANLPENLSDKWDKILSEEYNLEKPTWLPANSKKIPPEFKTDAWWKSRGL